MHSSWEGRESQPAPQGSLRGEEELSLARGCAGDYKSGTDDNCPGTIRTRMYGGLGDNGVETWVEVSFPWM